MTTFTKGPWQIDEFTSGQGIDQCSIMCADNNKVVCDIPDYKTGDHDESDARLIAAAPDLYRALEDLVYQAERCCDNCNQWLDYADAKQALARTRGDYGN